MRRQLLALVVALTPMSASAAFHLWQITEVFSNADGSVQFVELQDCATVPTCNGENLLTGHTITSTAESYTFQSNLPTATAGQHFLIATPGYASAPGAASCPADYTFNPLVPPSTQFMSVAGADTINFASVNTFSYAAGALPTDGYYSLNEPYGSDVRTQAANSPTNFAGNTCFLPEPSGGLAFAAGAALMLALRRVHPLHHARARLRV